MPAPEGEPRLPPELECYIFETMARMSPNSMRSLILVARRVKIWIEPILYEVLTLNAPRTADILRLSSHEPAPFFRERVNHVCFSSVPATDIAKILSLCSATGNLALLNGIHDNVLPSILETLPLARISLELFSYRPRLIDAHYHHPLFAGITHLDVLDWPSRGWAAWSGLALLPRLTHLSFRAEAARVPATVCGGVLLHCRLIEVLALVHSTPDQPVVPLPPISTAHLLETDPRFVVIVLPMIELVGDWRAGARGGRDHWALAEEIVRIRRHKQRT
ncbi:hypothetical protein C8R47DRAFT_216370 [Mycena vitilis]|nr:hypothetical protein C8R47DRAFT_216370 [Mycena vitilis]